MGHGTKGMWVNRALDSWPHPLIHDLDLEFSRSFFKQLHLRNRGRSTGGMTGIWVDRLLYIICDIELWLRPWILKVKFWKSSIIGIRGWIEMEPKGCESIGCWTQVMTLNFDLTHDLDLGFSRSNFNSHILWVGRPIDLEWKRCELDTILDA